jgi:hypothetical protein
MIPQSMQSEMLQKIHVNHFVAESSICMAREVIFWPGMRKSIQDTCADDMHATDAHNMGQQHQKNQ